jgi:DNA replication initiation complex subunit (GINS family)|tara:strand:+ start:2108 stop:2566 length:459 start_codon:yes stop_codon:yes gene_type:complete
MNSFELEESKEGDLIELPRWAAEEIAKLGFVEVQEESFEVEMLKALSRERIQSSNQISTLTDDFYLKLKRYLRRLKDDTETKKSSKNDYGESYIKAMDLLKIRTAKLLPLTVGEDNQEIMRKITSEEQTLFNEVRNTVQKWRKKILEVDIDE